MSASVGSIPSLDEMAGALGALNSNDWFLVWSSQLAAATLKEIRRKACSRAAGPNCNRFIGSDEED
jgi:hypothetical protein